MKMTHISVKHGFAPDYFSILKSQHKEKFEFIVSFDPSNLDNAFRKYRDYAEEKRQQVADIVFWVERYSSVFHFSTYLYAKGVFGARGSFSSNLSKNIFKVGCAENISVLRRLEKVIEAFAQYKEVVFKHRTAYIYKKESVPREVNRELGLEAFYPVDPIKEGAS